MTNFIYNMQDELFHLNMILPVGEFSPIKKLVDHIEAQGKQLRELNAAIAKRNATIEKYEREKKELQERNTYLIKKVQELNEGIRDSEDLTWKQKYDALLQSSEQAIGALQKKCQEYKNADTIDALVKENNELKEKNEKLKKNVNSAYGVASRTKDYSISFLENHIKTLEEENEKLKEDKKVIEKNFAYEMQVSKDLNVIINSKNKLLDEYMTKCNNLEHNYKEEVRMKERLKTICFRRERTIESQNSTIKYLKGQVADHVRLNAVLRGKLVSIGELANKIDDVILSEE